MKFLTLALLTILLVQCFNNSTDDSDDTGKSGAYGKILSPDNTPAQGVTVKFFPVSENPIGLTKRSVQAIDSVTTDENGEYQISTLSTDTYNVLGEDESGNLSFQDSVVVIKDEDIEIPTDTLHPPGSLKMIIDIQDIHDPRNVDVIFWGTNYGLVPIDSNGIVEIPEIAAGEYSVRIKLSVDYSVIDTVIVIESGEEIDLGEIRLPFLGIPVPSGVVLAYDTMFQVVNLTWILDSLSNIKGSNVYRKHSDSDFVKINTAVLTVPKFTDSTVILNAMYEYKITAVDNGDNEGEKSEGQSTEIISPYNHPDTLFTFPTFFHSLDSYEDNIYIGLLLDPYNSSSANLQIHDLEGTIQNEWEIPGGLENSLGYNAINVLSRDSLLIANNSGYIGFYNSTGNLLSGFKIGFRLRGIAIHNNAIYLGNLDTKQIIKYSISGDSLLAFGNNVLSHIRDIHTDSSGYIYVVDQSAGDLRETNVEVFSENGEFIKELFRIPSTSGTPLEISGSSIFIGHGISITQSIIWEFDLEGKQKSKFTIAQSFSTINRLNNGDLLIGSGFSLFRYRKK